MSERMAFRRLWYWVFSRVGGFYEIGPYFVVIHNGGISAGKDRIQKWNWRKRLWRPHDQH